MKQVTFGKTGEQVSALCLGWMLFGTRVSEETSFQLADQYFEAGGRFVDTSNNYAFWMDGGTGDESESLMGRWMKERKNRDQLFLATKVGARPRFPGGGLENAQGLSAQVILKEVDESLRRLGTDHIDLYYAHIDDRATSLVETLAAFDELVKMGKVRYIGCSNYMTWRIEQARNISRAHDWAAYCCVQQRHTYLRARPGATTIGSVFNGRKIQVNTTDELLDYCAAQDDFTLLAYSPLLSGFYTRNGVDIPDYYVNSDRDARMKALMQVAAEVGATPNQVVLAWMMQSTPTVIPIIAASTREQLSENLGALHVHLSQQQMETLNAAAG